MTRTPSLSVLVAFAVAVSGCSTPPPKLEPLPTLTLLQPRVPPGDLDLTVTVPVPRTELDQKRLAENVTPSKDFKAPAAARVVISVPVEEQSREGRMQDGFPADAGSTRGLDFKTTGYFNKAEQQIEKSLLEKGFQVLDRSKFEAKLREQRSRKNVAGENPAKLAEVQAVEEKKASGEITLDQWAEQLKAIEKKYAASDGGGRRAGKQELVDISELMRAAQDGEVQADFILQVNTFQTQQVSDRRIELITRPEVSRLCNQHPGLREALSESGTAVANQPGFFGLLNAKLIEVKTGNIGWVGDHRVDTDRVTDFKILLPITKHVDNAHEIDAAVNQHNKQLRVLASRCENAQATFDEAVRKGLGSDQVKQLADSYHEVRRQLVQAIEQGPSKEATAAWQYKYIFGKLLTQPVIPTEDVQEALLAEYAAARPEQKREIEQRIIQAREFLMNHYSELAKVVSRELISALPAN
jgi:hypothetical protein